MMKEWISTHIDNTADAISRIEEWSKIDKDRMDSVDDHIDIDDDSIGVNATEIASKKIYMMSSLKLMKWT